MPDCEPCRELLRQLDEDLEQLDREHAEQVARRRPIIKALVVIACILATVGVVVGIWWGAVNG